MKEKRLGKAIIYHIVVFIIGVIMIYPLLWMVMSSFKETGTIFTTAGSLIPETFTLENYTNGWKGFAKVPFSAFFKNSMLISVLATLGTIMSSALVAYGFARFKFFGHNILFAAMLVTMMLPAQVLMIPQYLWYQKLGWVGTYLPLIVPYFFATQGFLSEEFQRSWMRRLKSTAVLIGAFLSISCCRLLNRRWLRPVFSHSSGAGMTSFHRCCMSANPASILYPLH